MVYLSIVICLLVCMISLRIWGDPLSPPVVLSVLWLTMYVILVATYHSIVNFTVIYALFALSTIVFFLGFFFVVQRKRSNTKRERKMINIQISGRFHLIIFVLLTAVAIFDFSELYGLATGIYGTGDLWNDFLHAYRSEEAAENLILSYSLNALYSLLLVSFAVFCLNKTRVNRKYLIWASILNIPFILGNSRATLIMILITGVFVLCVIENFENRKIIRWGIFLLLILVVVFVFTAVLKGKPYFESGWSKAEYFSMTFQSYFSSPMVAFGEWYNSGYQMTYGQSTFRMFFALMKLLNSDLLVENIIYDFTTVNGVSTNIYTGLYVYVKDFGVAFACLMMGIIGAFHGVLYKKAVLNKKINLFCIMMFSLMMHPLVQMYASEAYFSALSTWVQFAFWFFLFTYDGILVKVKGIQI